MSEIHPRLQNLLMSEARIPGRARATSLVDLHPEGKFQVRSHRRAAAFVDNLKDHYVSSTRLPADYPADTTTIGKGLLLLGPPGTGKTTLAAAVAREALLRYRMPVLFLAHADLLSAKVEQIRLDPQVRQQVPTAVDRYWELDEFLRRAETVPLLVLDDVGKERRTGSGFAEDETDMLIRARYRAMRPTIVTSNIAVDAWGKVYNESMGSFIHEAFEILPMPGQDRRAEG